MCLIIFKPKGIKFNLTHIDNAMYFNSDGMGISIRTKKGVEVLRGIEFEYLEENYDMLTSHEVVLHLRYGTSGKKTVEQCHPFLIGKRTDYTSFLLEKGEQILYHNGIMFSPKLELGYSDTQIMARGMRSIKDLDPYIGTNKFLVQDNKRTLFMGNWHEVEGMWYSNLFYHHDRSYYKQWEDEKSKYWSKKCPVCGNDHSELVSTWNEVYECEECYAMFDSQGNVILNKWYA